LKQFPTKEAAYFFLSPEVCIVVANGSYLQIMDSNSGTVLPETRSKTGDYYFAAWDPTGKKIAAAGSDHTVHVGRQPRQTLPADAGSVNSVQWSHDSRYLLSAHDSNLARIWDVNDPEVFRDLQHSASVQFAAWSSDDTHIATVTSSGDITLWDASSGEILRHWKSQNQIIWSVSWSQDDTQLLTAENDGSVHIWEARSLEELQTLAHTTDVMSVAWSPDNSRVVTAGGLSLTAFIWDLQENTITQVLTGHEALD
jgi:WD40 repeat protein